MLAGVDLLELGVAECLLCLGTTGANDTMAAHALGLLLAKP